MADVDLYEMFGIERTEVDEPVDFGYISPETRKRWITDINKMMWLMNNVPSLTLEQMRELVRKSNG